MPFGFGRNKKTGLSGKPPIIVGGCYRSGTTLVRRILDAHSAIHCPPEVKFFKDFHGDFDDDSLHRLRFFRTVRQMGVGGDNLLRIFGSAFVECHELAAARAGKSRWADKNPENTLYMDNWMSVLEGRLLFLQVARHPLDILCSLIEAGFDQTVPTDFEGKVELVRQYFDAAAAFIDTNPDISMTLRYEDLVASPEETLRTLLTFVGETFESAPLHEFNAKERRSGVEDQKIKGTTSIHSDSVGRWQRDLDATQLAFAARELAKAAARHGYDLPG